MQAIFSRRSVRRFTSEPVDDETVRTLLRAAMRAPSAGNAQPWQFVVIRRRDTMDAIRAVHPYAGPLATAACAVVVCGDLDREKFPGYWVQDCAAATQNLLLEAETLGLGAVWMGVYPDARRTQALQALLGLPETVLPLNVTAVGRPAERPAPLDTYRPERVHRERWE